MATNTYIGQTFLEEDPRTLNRTIKILGQHSSGKYNYEVLTDERNPKRVGTHGRISAKTLDKDWKKISHGGGYGSAGGYGGGKGYGE